MSKRTQHSDHISREEILRYLNAECTSSEMHQIERHLLHCEFCEDAMEGIEKANASIEYESGLKSLDDKLKKRVQKGKRKNIGVWRVAAVALLIIISGYFINTFLFQRSQNIQLTEKKEEPKKLESEEEELVKEEPSSAEATEGKVEGKEVVEELKGVDELKGEKEPENNYTSSTQIVENNEIEVDENTSEISVASGAAASYDFDSADAAYASVINEDAKLKEVEISSEEIEIVAYEVPLIDKDEATIDAEFSNDEVAREEAIISTTQVSAERSNSQKKNVSMSADSGRIISGVVSSEDTQETLPYVVVVNKDKETGTVTDMDGSYQIEAEPGDEIEVSYIGFNTQQIEVGEEDEVNVAMQSGVDLDEFVVTKSKADIRNSKAKPMMGESGFTNYLKENVIYPDEAKEAGISGKVSLEFTIDVFGYAKDFVVLKGLGYGCDEEAIRLVREGPIWFPAMDNGSPIEEKVKLKVSFK